MKYFITYNQNGTTKKAVLDETKYNNLLKEGAQQVVVYANEVQMEQEFSKLLNEGTGLSNKQILKG